MHTYQSLGETKDMEKINPTYSRPLMPHHQDFINHQNQCPLCTTPLIIRIEPSHEDFSLREEAQCPKCQVLARVKDHNLN